MARESKANKRSRAIEVCERMARLYPEAECALNFEDAFQCVIAVSLSAQTTDANVNKVTPELFRRWPTPAAMAGAHEAEVAEVIHSLGFFRNKAKNCVACAQMLCAEFGGEVPNTMADLQKLPGVGRKTANIVLNNVFDIVEGIAVDTHVKRLARKLRFTTKDDPSQIEQDLLALLPRELWKPVNHQWILFGREVCIARRPQCPNCPLADLCPEFGK